MNTRIKKLRSILKLTQSQFGEKVGLKPTSICDIENGRCNVNDRLFIAICSKFNVNENWLRFGKGNIFNQEDKKFNEFFEIYKNLKLPMQEFLIDTAKNLADLQNKL